jgi:hypothetical protein
MQIPTYINRCLFDNKKLLTRSNARAFVLVYIINHNFIIEQIVHTKDDALAYARATPLVLS